MAPTHHFLCTYWKIWQWRSVGSVKKVFCEGSPHKTTRELSGSVVVVVWISVCGGLQEMLPCSASPLMCIKGHSCRHTLRDHCSVPAMETSSVLLVCILVTCSGVLQNVLHSMILSLLSFSVLQHFLFCLFTVWTVHGRSLEVNIDDQEQVELNISVEAGKVTWQL